MEGLKKNRSENWEREEKSYLLELISEEINAIEDKRTDIDALKRKDMAWGSITKKFAVKYGNKDKKRLKEQYQRLKLKAKEEFRNFDKHMKQTGGGPPGKTPGALSEIIHNLLPGEFINPINPFDEDAPR